MTGVGFRERLRSATADAHREMERHALVEEISSSLPSYYSFLDCLKGPWMFWECALAATPLIHMGGLKLVERFRGKLLLEDLRNLRSRLRGLVSDSEDELAFPSIEKLNLPRAAGVLYVLEGSRFGGRSILERLAPLGVTPDCAGSFFFGYGEKTASMWTGFLDWVDENVREADYDQSVEAALEVFGGFTDAWLEKSHD